MNVKKSVTMSEVLSIFSCSIPLFWIFWYAVCMSEFHDINRFPKDWGLLVFPISMSRIATGQHQKHYIEWLLQLAEKIQSNQVGANFLYSDGLYMNFENNAFETKNRFASTATSHKQGMLRLLDKHRQTFQIRSAFSFQSWFQMYLSHPDFFARLSDIRKLYSEDTLFQRYVALDAQDHERELTVHQIEFYLEEILFYYLASNRQLHFSNEYVQNREQWVLLCYPGSPLRAEIYLHQLDPFGLNSEKNPYKGSYDLSKRVFINHETVDLKQYNPTDY